MLKKSIIALFIAAGISLSCMWDYDTIEMERKQFPTAVEIMAGKFLRHSPEFYYWRALDREKAIMEHPDSLQLYDDMAVAWSKLGEDEKAIAIMLQKEEKSPGLYETEANLGTFYIHNGQLEEGLEHIKKAIEINPDAHFGRERYQQYLVEYLLSRNKDGKVQLPINGRITKYYPQQQPASNFYTFVMNKRRKLSASKEKQLVERDKAIEGILGMMRFGNYNSPILLEALGDLLMGFGHTRAHRNLAGRAYLRAAFEVKDEAVQSSYRKLAINAMYSGYFKNSRGGRLTLEVMETQLKKEIAEGDAFYEQIKKDEWEWIRARVNVDAAYSKKYFENPTFDIIEYEGYGKTRKSDEEYRKVRNGRGAVRKSDFQDLEFKELPLDSAMQALMYNDLLAAYEAPIDSTTAEEQPKAETDKKDSGKSSNSAFIMIALSLLLGGIVIFLGIKSNR
jgi:tetratricopeptide (TPR) repeat protein